VSRPRTIRLALATSAALALLGAARGARAVDKLDVTEEEAPTLSRRSVKLFDTRRAQFGLEVDTGPMWYRSVHDRFRELGTMEIRAGQTITTPNVKGLYLTGMQQTNFRIFGEKSFAWSVLFHTIGAGVRVGPFEPEAHFSTSILTLDVFRGNYSVELLSPRAGAHLGIHVGKIRLDFGVYSEYLWRWFGPSYLIRGLSFGLRLDVPRPKGPNFTETAPRGPVPGGASLQLIPFLPPGLPLP
jgi:hypothetical protein